MSAIDDYLAELERELRLPRARRRRVLAEAADHLHEAAAGAGGPEAAVAAFGPARVVARRFADELAARDVAGAGWAAATAAVGFGLMVAVTGRFDGVAAFGVQFAFVGGLLTLIRLLRHRRDVVVPAAKLRLLQRGAALTLAAAAVTLVADAIAGHGHAWLLAAVGALVAIAAARLGLAQRSLAAARTFDDAPPGEDIVDDLGALAPQAAAALAALARAGLDLRHRPWRTATVVALVAGAAVAAGHATEGIPTADVHDALRAALASVVLIGIEAAAVLAGFAVLRRWLGLSAAAS